MLDRQARLVVGFFTDMLPELSEGVVPIDYDLFSNLVHNWLPYLPAGEAEEIRRVKCAADEYFCALKAAKPLAPSEEQMYRRTIDSFLLRS